MDEKKLNSLVEEFVNAVGRTFNKQPDGGRSFFEGLPEHEINFILYAGLEKTSMGIKWRPRTLAENLGVAEIYARTAEYKKMQNFLKPSIPAELKTTDAALALLEKKKAPRFATLCCPIKFD